MRNALLFSGLAAVTAAQQNNVQAQSGLIRFPVTAHRLPQDDSDGSETDKRAATPVDLKRALLGGAYTIDLKIGTPAQTVSVQLDTGSTELWVDPNCNNANVPDYCRTLGYYNMTKSSSVTNLKKKGVIVYGTGNTSLTYVSDVVRAGSATVKNQTFGVATNSYWNPFGILGVGPYLGGNFPYSFFIDSLKSQGLTNSRAFSLDLRSIENTVGSIIFGGIDTGKYIGALAKIPIIPPQNAPDGAPRYWVKLDSVSTGGTKLSTSSFPVLLDSGTTLSLIPSYLHTAIGKMFPTAQLDPQSGYYFVNCSVADMPGSIDFQFGSKVIKVAYKDFIWFANYNLCVIGTQPVNSFFILGDSFLRGAYAVFDQDQQNVHLAQAANCGTNLVAIGSGTNAVPSLTGQCTATGTSTAKASQKTTMKTTTSLSRRSVVTTIKATTTYTVKTCSAGAKSCKTGKLTTRTVVKTTTLYPTTTTKKA